ncbi:DUF3006 domain-containing protein [Deinococcus radiotolerans]|uniref:DUF3006 domain-containing protein n=1 Tax=Deinococcus radiotolerans TaxID=1309407 RepID=A0ABQ2FQT9_9DEIO|nr:DUF3006 domain-containing protein [Deinococcus radiotolerans]GGL17802.1 hypothetical protein GCM10010844_40820 [Deinococcus radiotolerans]
MADQPGPPAHATVTVDALEGPVVRVELPDGTTQDWARLDLPRDVQEGDVLHVRVEDGERHVRIDRAETRRRTQRAQAELTELNAGSPDGELDL